MPATGSKKLMPPSSKYIVRPMASYAMPEFLRVTVGTEAENARFLAALKQALAS